MKLPCPAGQLVLRLANLARAHPRTNLNRLDGSLTGPDQLDQGTAVVSGKHNHVPLICLKLKVYLPLLA